LPWNAIRVYNEVVMKTLDEIKHVLHAQKPYLAERYGVIEVGVFGSYVRGEQDPDSDVDVLVELEEPPRIDLFDLVNLEYHLTDLLGVDVDVVIKGDLRKRIGQRIMGEVFLV
jgi:predicted nucleotidyltransferase